MRFSFAKKLTKFAAVLLPAFVIGAGLCSCGYSTPAPLPNTANETAADGEEAKAEAEVAEVKPTEVNYATAIYCADSMQAKIEEWNKTTGKEENIIINLVKYENEDELLSDCLMGKYELFDDVNGIAGRTGAALDIMTTGKEISALADANAAYLRDEEHRPGGVLTSLPRSAEPVKMLVNKDLLKKNTIGIPETWNDIVNAAQIITENADGDIYGFGWAKDSGVFKTYAMEETAKYTGKGWFDTETGRYDFAAYTPVIRALYEMYINNWLIGAEEYSVDEMINEFAEGKIGIIPVKSSDVFELIKNDGIKCDWDVIDPPAFKGDEERGGVYEAKPGPSICAELWNKATTDEQAAFVKAFCYLYSDELLGEMYYNDGLILERIKDSASENHKLDKLSSLAGYSAMTWSPDSLITVEGDDYEKVFIDLITEEVDWDDSLFDDLSERYNNAYDVFLGNAEGIADENVTGDDAENVTDEDAGETTEG